MVKPFFPTLSNTSLLFHHHFFWKFLIQLLKGHFLQQIFPTKSTDHLPPFLHHLTKTYTPVHSWLEIPPFVNVFPLLSSFTGGHPNPNPIHPTLVLPYMGRRKSIPWPDKISASVFWRPVNRSPWQPEIRQTHQLRLVSLSTIISRVSKTSQVIAGFLNHTFNIKIQHSCR